MKVRNCLCGSGAWLTVGVGWVSEDGREAAPISQVTFVKSLPQFPTQLNEEVKLNSLKGLLSTDILQFFCLELKCVLGVNNHFFPVYRIFSFPWFHLICTAALKGQLDSSCQCHSHSRVTKTQWLRDLLKLTGPKPRSSTSTFLLFSIISPQVNLP